MPFNLNLTDTARFAEQSKKVRDELALNAWLDNHGPRVRVRRGVVRSAERLPLLLYFIALGVFILTSAVLIIAAN